MRQLRRQLSKHRARARPSIVISDRSLRRLFLRASEGRRRGETRESAKRHRHVAVIVRSRIWCISRRCLASPSSLAISSPCDYSRTDNRARASVARASDPSSPLALSPLVFSLTEGRDGEGPEPVRQPGSAALIASYRYRGTTFQMICPFLSR